MIVEADVRITVLVENTAPPRDLLAEHGLSFWIEHPRGHILFDTGRTDAFAHNARVLGIDLSLADAIVLSHGHSDHSGGLAMAMQIAPTARVYLHPEALSPKFSRHADGAIHDLTLPSPALDQLRARLIFTERPTEVLPGVFASGAIPRRHDFEAAAEGLFLDPACTRPDLVPDDQSLYFPCAKGIVILVGCAHAGIINTIDHIRAASGGGPIYAVIGGLHLRSASEARMLATLDALRQRDLHVLAPAHCTGRNQTARLQRTFPDRFRECAAGSRFVFELMEKA